MVIDLLLLFFAGWGFFMGFNRGIIKTVFTVLSYTLGFTAAVKFAPPMTKLLEDLLNYDNPLMFLVGFILSFVLVMLAIRAIARFLEGALETVNLNIINKAIGGGVMAGLMVLLFSVLLEFAVSSNAVNGAAISDSKTYPMLKQYPAQVWKVAEFLKPTFQDFWDHSVDFLDGVRDLGDETLERTESDPIIRDVD